jgi:hypothetical protein
MTQPPDKSPFEHLTNAQVVDEHRRRGPADTIYVSEMLLRLMIQLSAQATATDSLTKSISRLNWWLLLFLSPSLR